MVKQRQKTKDYKSLSKVKESDSDDEKTELFVRRKSPKKEIPTVEKNVEEGDTLQSLAIRYHCTIEELKRLNNIHKENEIYARLKLKVPYRPFTEALAPVHDSGASSPNCNLVNLRDPSASQLIDVDEVENKLQNVAKLQEVTLNSPFRHSSPLRSPSNCDVVNEIIFNSSIQKPPVERLEPFHDEPTTEDEVIQLLPHRDAIFKPDPIVTTVSKLSCNGSDWDISWPLLIVCIVGLVVGVPLILLYVAAEHPEAYNHHIDDIVNGTHMS